MKMFKSERPAIVVFISLCSFQGHPTDRFGKLSVQFGRPLIRYDFLKGLFTSIFRDMGNLRTSVFRLIKMSFRH